MAKELTLEEIQGFVKKYASTFAKYRNRIEIVALKEVEGLMKRRIFNRGESADGGGIGSNRGGYSSSPMLVGASSFATKTKADQYFKAIKSLGVAQWVTYKGRKLDVLTGGYKQLRNFQGFQTSHVDLMYKGDLFRSVQVGKTADNDNVIGFTSDKQRLKAEGQEAHWNKDIFAISKQESDAMNKAIIKEIDFIISKI